MTEILDPAAPSSDRNAEMATVAAAMQTTTARDEARRHITGADLLDPNLERVWDAMSRLDREGVHVDANTLLSVFMTDAVVAQLLAQLLTWPVIPDHVTSYASTVREWAMRRRLYTEGIRVQQAALNTAADIQGLASACVTRFTSLRDSGSGEDIESVTLDELLAEEDDEPDWVVPGLLERQDRLILTGEEGLGKSYLLRQIAVMAAAGLDPFDFNKRIQPVRVLIVDCENPKRQVRRKVRPIVQFARKWGAGNPGNVNLLCSTRIDITRDRDLARIHRHCDVIQPEIIVIGPLYRITKGALQSDDDAAPVLSALDTLRDRGAVLLIEAHAGHSIGRGGVRDLRPRGSSALLGWPEFGYGMRAIPKTSFADFSNWRGDRDERDWPDRLRVAPDGFRWVPCEPFEYDQEEPPW